MICHGQYPQMVYRKGERMLWNPIARKPYVNRPEERVRLRLVDYLTQRAGWSRNRISFERPLLLNRSSATGRADLVCYNQKVEPVLLVECKAEQSMRGNQVAEQIARYGQNISTDWWLVTNGLQDFWFQNENNRKFVQLAEPPPPFSASGEINSYPITYWQERAFASKQLSSDHAGWLERGLNFYFIEQNPDRIQYLNFNTLSLDFDISHYYYLHPAENSAEKTALTFLQTPEDTTLLIAVINRRHTNVGLITVDLGALLDGAPDNSRLFARDGIQTFDFNTCCRSNLNYRNSVTFFGTLPSNVIQIFNQLT